MFVNPFYIILKLRFFLRFTLFLIPKKKLNSIKNGFSVSSKRKIILNQLHSEFIDPSLQRILCGFFLKTTSFK